MQATGSFDVELIPQGGSNGPIAQMSITKHFHGPLDATSAGEMLAVHTATAGSAGYVAMEHVTGTLDGRSGSFVLQHSGTMGRHGETLSVTVIPDSATGDLEGLTGTMSLRRDRMEHFYSFEYEVK
jgi:hypothetical protein